MKQRIFNTTLRIAGRLIPKVGGLDFRLIRRLQRALPAGARHPWKAGNGFLLGPETSNVTFIAGASERAFLQMVLKEIVREGMIINVGANIGYTSLYLARALCRADHSNQILAVEPEPQTFELLRRNVALNSLAIEVECVAAGSEESLAKIYSTGPGDGAASLEVRGSCGIVEHTVRVRPLDNMLAERPKETVVGLIIDVEGYGGAVLRGSKQTLRSHRPFVAAEIHSSREREELEAVLAPLSYKVSSRSTDIWGDHIIWRFIGQ